MDCNTVRILSESTRSSHRGRTPSIGFILLVLSINFLFNGVCMADSPASEMNFGDFGPESERLGVDISSPSMEDQQRFFGWSEEPLCLTSAKCPEDKPYCIKPKKRFPRKICTECRNDQDCLPAESCSGSYTCVTNPTILTVLKYDGITVDDFTTALRNQVCTNLLSLVPGGFCEVLGVYPGSVIIVVRITYPNAQSTSEFVVILDGDSPQTQQVLVKDFPEGTTVNVTAVAEDTTPRPPLPTLGPSNVQTTPGNTCEPQLLVSWNASSGATAPVVAYIVECVMESGMGTSVLVESPATRAIVDVAANLPYECGVASASFQGTSAAVRAPSVSYSYPDSCVSPPTSVEAVASIECTPGITVSWTKPSAQPEPDEYKVTCTDGSTPVEKTVVASEQPTTTLTTGIQPSVAYSCQVVSVKGSEESSPASATPPEVTYSFLDICKPGDPRDLDFRDISRTSVGVTWTDGLAGNPEETYTVSCVEGDSTSCLQDPGITTGAEGIARGEQQGTVTGLQPNTTYSCWVQAVNEAGTTCSTMPVTVTTWIEAGEPRNLRISLALSDRISFQWDDGLAGNPEETYTVSCAPPDSTSCNDPGISSGAEDVARGVQKASVTGLEPDMMYRCWVKAINDAGTTCMSLDVKTIPAVRYARWFIKDTRASINKFEGDNRCPSGCIGPGFCSNYGSSGPAACEVQASEFNFYVNGELLRPLDGIRMVSNEDGINPSNEGPGKLVDGNVNTKWLDLYIAFGTSLKGSTLLFDFSGEYNINGYNWYTANDFAGRDPTDWTVEVSNDGSTWFELDSVENYDPTKDRKELAYEILF